MGGGSGSGRCALAVRRSLRLLLALALVAALAPAGAQAGLPGGAWPDLTFGDGRGYVTLELSGQSTIAYAATATSDGIVVTGQASPNGNGTGQVLVAKYDSSGKLDASFGAQGIYRSSLPEVDGPFLATAVARGVQGRLLVAGGYGPGSVLVLRLTARGQLDGTFGTAGVTTIPVGSIAQSMAVQKDGRILVGASNLNENGRPMVVVRLMPSGAVDHSFGTNGKTEILFWDANHASRPGSPAWRRPRRGQSSAPATSTTSAATGTAAPVCSSSPPAATSTPATAQRAARRSRSPTRTARSRSGSRAR